MKINAYAGILRFSAAVCILLVSCNKNDSTTTPASPQGGTNPVVTPTTITSINPANGPATTSVTINGTGFSDTLTHDSVFFNGIKAAVVSATATQIVTTVPLGAGSGKVNVYIDGVPVAGPVFTYDSSYIVSTLAGSGSSGYSDATGIAATFIQPVDLVTDANGNIYVTDQGANAVRKITPAGVVTTLAGGLSVGSADGTGTAASFKQIFGIAIDGSGNLYVADEGNNKIRKITPGGVVSTLAGSGSMGAADATGSAASFFAPCGLAVDGSGNVFVADAGNNKIREITAAGVVTTLAGSGTPGGVDGTGTAATFNTPIGVAVDGNDNVYISEGSTTLAWGGNMYPGNNKIRKITSSGVVSTFAGSGTLGATDGTGTAATFHNPYGIRADVSGNIYVADAGNNKIRVITTAGVVTTFAGSGGSSATDGPAASAGFSSPTGVAIEANGNVYVADANNLKIRKISRQ